eukprot:5847006-Pyramimonas_sp.AAC.1
MHARGAQDGHHVQLADEQLHHVSCAALSPARLGSPNALGHARPQRRRATRAARLLCPIGPS